MATIDIEYAADQSRLEELLESVDRPGGFCTHGRENVPMPTLEVDGQTPCPAFWKRPHKASAALAGVLKPAADEAECELYTAITHVDEAGLPLFTGDEYFDDWGGQGYAAGDLEMDEGLDGRYWLDGWTGADGSEPALGVMSLRDGEILPAGVLDGAVAWAEQQIGRDETAAPGLIARLIDIWPAAAHYQSAGDRADQGRARMLRLLGRLGSAALTLRFLREVLLQHYNGSENQVLPEALAVAGPAGAKEFLGDLIESRFCLWPGATLELLVRVGELADFDGRDTLGDSVLPTLAAFANSARASRHSAKTPPRRSGAFRCARNCASTCTGRLTVTSWTCFMSPNGAANPIH